MKNFNLETEQPALLSTILDLVQASSSADLRRRSENLRTSVVTLSDLTKELQLLGFKISQTAAYYRLLPKRGDTIEAKRHVQTVPVRLCR